MTEPAAAPARTGLDRGVRLALAAAVVIIGAMLSAPRLASPPGQVAEPPAPLHPAHRPQTGSVDVARRPPPRPRSGPEHAFALRLVRVDTADADQPVCELSWEGTTLGHTDEPELWRRLEAAARVSVEELRDAEGKEPVAVARAAVSLARRVPQRSLDRAKAAVRRAGIERWHPVPSALTGNVTRPERPRPTVVDVRLQRTGARSAPRVMVEGKVAGSLGSDAAHARLIALARSARTRHAETAPEAVGVEFLVSADPGIPNAELAAAAQVLLEAGFVDVGFADAQSADTARVAPNGDRPVNRRR